MAKAADSGEPRRTSSDATMPFPARPGGARRVAPGCAKPAPSRSPWPRKGQLCLIPGYARLAARCPPRVSSSGTPAPTAWHPSVKSAPRHRPGQDGRVNPCPGRALPRPKPRPVRPCAVTIAQPRLPPRLK